MRIGLFYQIQVPKPWGPSSAADRFCEAKRIEELFMLCAVGAARYEEVVHMIRMFGEQIIPHFRAKEAAFGQSVYAI